VRDLQTAKHPSGLGRWGVLLFGPGSHDFTPDRHSFDTTPIGFICDDLPNFGRYPEKKIHVLLSML
jgi:hypothetical protein